MVNDRGIDLVCLILVYVLDSETSRESFQVTHFDEPTVQLIYKVFQYK